MRLLWLFLFTCSIFASMETLPHDLTGTSSGPNKIGYLHLEKDHAIDSSTVLYVKFSLDHFKKEGVKLVVLDLDTPGGEVFAAIKICEMLKNLDLQDKIPVIAYIDNWAISAGAMIAYSCRYIGITSSASMGAAEPILIDAKGDVSSASEKMVSALRSEFTNLAALWGRDPNLAEAMVDKDVILVWRDGRVVRLDDEKQIRLGEDTVITHKGKLLTLNAMQLQKFGVADFETNDLFTSPILAKIPNHQLVTYENWKIDFFAFLSHPAVMSLLTLGLIAGFYFELQHPGLTFPLVIGLACLSLILLSQFSLHTIDWLEAILLVSGVALLSLEIFVLPGFGVAGVLGILLTIAGLATITLPHIDTVSFFPHWNLAAIEFVDHLAWFCGILLAGIVLIFFLSRKMIHRFVLAGELPTEVPLLPEAGTEGSALTQLKPSGKVTIDGQVYEAITEGRFVEKGSSIFVLRQESNKLYVRQK